MRGIVRYSPFFAISVHTKKKNWEIEQFQKINVNLKACKIKG